MAKAKILPPNALEGLLDDIARESVNPERDFVIILLSCKGGLRAQEIAGLTWHNVTNAFGEIGDTITVPAGIAKKGHARTIPMHPMVRESLEVLRPVWGHERIGSRLLKITPFEPQGRQNVILGAKNGSAISPNALQRYMGRLYQKHGLDASSHSGRRTMITELARTANAHGCSLFDVQRIAGHRDIETTEAYVEHSDNIVDLIRSL